MFNYQCDDEYLITDDMCEYVNMLRQSGLTLIYLTVDQIAALTLSEVV